MALPQANRPTPPRSTAEPGVVSGSSSRGWELLFYDGTCGLCHATVRFVLRRDRTGEAFRFAPLGGVTFLEVVPEAERRDLPDSVVVRTRQGGLLCRSTAVIHILRRLGGVWKFLGNLLALVPRPLRDLGYGAVARTRRHLFRRPETACPLVAPELRRRFDP